jgi:protein-S-isoprenylcysteine O-methyltransferase Ste14
VGSARARSIAATLVLVAAVALLFARHAVLARHPAGMTLQGAAVALMVGARVTFGARSFHAAADPTEGGLVTWGPYRY